MKSCAFLLTVIIVTLPALTAWNLSAAGVLYKNDHDDDYQQDSMIKGPHGGRLLQQDDFSLEIVIYEKGLPPEFRVYAYRKNAPVPVAEVSLNIELTRLGGKVDRIGFSPEDNYLKGNGIVYEPHSFDVRVTARHAGKAYEWQYENYEGRTSITESIASQMGIVTEVVGPVTIKETRTLTGRVHTNPNRLSRVYPRFPGVVTAIRKELGDTVNAGDTLASVQSNESLQVYDVKAPINGLIIKRDIQTGEATGADPLFILVDLSDVWVELDVFIRDLDHIRSGQPVRVETLDGRHQGKATIDWISPLTAHASQSVRARIILPNEDGAWRPGQFIRGHVTIAEHRVPRAVRQSALQRFRDFQVVFARVEDTYEVRMLELGRRDRDWVEVLDGIDAGTYYVTGNSYLIKADIEKSGASHDH